jgi:hypothetical protein
MVIRKKENRRNKDFVRNGSEKKECDFLPVEEEEEIFLFLYRVGLGTI